MRKVVRVMAWSSLALVVLLAVAGAAALYVFYTFGQTLPEYSQLKEYKPAVMTRVHAGDGSLMAEFAVEKRVFVPIGAVPQRVVNAFLSAEDKNFFDHPGIDLVSIAGAAVTNVSRFVKGQRMAGASTITQQVAKNFLLTNEYRLTRKIKEAILALRIERALGKNRILELYMNEIYLGGGAYGVAAAAVYYFDKALGELTIEEAAYLAALPKAPNNYHPTRKYEAAVWRRNWVIGRMVEDGKIAAADGEAAKAAPLVVRQRKSVALVRSDYFAEDVRRQLMGMYGETGLYKSGLLVRTTLDPRLQKIAETSLRQGLLAYDRRHGWRGPFATFDPAGDWRESLASATPDDAPDAWRTALVVGLDKKGADIAFGDGSLGRVPFAEMRWARAWKKDQKRGPSLKKPADALNIGDAVLVETELFAPPAKKGADPESYPPGTFGLRQLPDIDGAVVILDPHTGRVLAMQGGFSALRSEFNRATQAKRQPGSAFKPFVYMAALDAGLTPTTIILDAPFVIDQGPDLPKWRPANYSNKFYGLSTMRLGIEKSRNLMTVRLAQAIGMETVVDYARRFGIVDDMPAVLAMSLGSGETTLMRLTTGYAMIVNGGKRITPSIIDRIQDRNGATIFRHDKRACPACVVEAWDEQAVPAIPDERETVVDPMTAYQMTSMLNGVVRRGTGRRIASLRKPLGGKTGTTNNSIDTWFIGFSADLAVGVFVGFDQPKSQGKRETGSSVAAPIFKSIMAEALKDKPAVPFRIPKGLRLVRVDARTGVPARAGAKGVIFEAFKPGNVPARGEEPRMIGAGITAESDSSSIGDAGLY